MGVIQRQSIKGSIVNYSGVLLGLFATLYIYPLEWELYGGIQYWLSVATILGPILRQGSTALINKYYPYFKSIGAKGFLGLILVITTATIIVMSLLIFIFSLFISDTAFYQNLNLNSDNLLYVYLLSITLIYYSVFQLHSANVRRIVVPELISKIGIKVLLILIIVSAYFNLIEHSLALPLLVLSYLFSLLVIIFYLLILRGFDVKGWRTIKVSKTLKKSMFKFWAFGGLNYLGVILAYKIDIFMIGTIVNKVSVGYYSIFLFMVNLMIIPMTSISQISGPIVSESFEKDDISSLDKLYKVSSNNILVFGVLIFLFIWINIYYLLDIMKNGQDLIPYVSILLFLGIAKVFDLMTSINNLIMIYSKWYRFNLVFLFVMSVINFTLNIYLLKTYGIQGAAIATAISLLIFNGIKTGFIYAKLKIHPFSRKTFIILGVLIIGLLIAGALQHLMIFNSFVSLIIYSFITAGVYIPLFYLLKVSPELNKVIQKVLKIK